MRIGVIVHDGDAGAYCCFITHQKRREKFIAMNILFECCRKDRSYYGCTGMGTNEIMSVIYIISIRGMSHRRSGSDKRERLLAADYRDTTGSESLFRKL